ncbi:MAG TPA: hypothetical protein VMX56_02290, partial [Anaerolineales bacterium]|nr:hypothetical protein [Anaerolineales bacterium]
MDLRGTTSVRRTFLYKRSLCPGPASGLRCNGLTRAALLLLIFQQFLRRAHRATFSRCHCGGLSVLGRSFSVSAYRLTPPDDVRLYSLIVAGIIAENGTQRQFSVLRRLIPLHFL